MTKGRTKRRCIERVGSSGTGFRPHRLDFQRIKGRVSHPARISGLGWEVDGFVWKFCSMPRDGSSHEYRFMIFGGLE
jgi:hypothetical protein